MTNKYHSLDQKLLNLQKLNGPKNNTGVNVKTNPKFYPRVINLTNISFNDDENKLLQKGLKYNIHLKPKQWIKTLALEAETAINLLPTTDHNPIRYQLAKTIEKLADETHQKRIHTVRHPRAIVQPEGLCQ
jgi:hypothetical protein